MDVREIEKRVPSNYEEEVARVRDRYSNEELRVFKKNVEIAKDLYGLFYKSMGQAPAHPYVYDVMTDYVNMLLNLDADIEGE
nr:MAG TPA: hypothetical protein [Caudoviricetes sp.]